MNEIIYRYERTRFYWLWLINKAETLSLAIIIICYVIRFLNIGLINIYYSSVSQNIS